MRKLGFWMCLALVIGNMIGSGVFLLPTALAPFGYNVIGAWIFTILGVLTIVVVMGRLARILPDADGPYGYTLAAFGPQTAFMIGYSYWISVWVGNAAIATAAVSYLTVLFPPLGATPLISSLVAVALIWAITFINMLGARTVGSAQVLTTLIKLVPLLVIIILAALVAARTGGAAVAPSATSGLSFAAMSAAAALCLWPMVGFESAAFASSSVENASSTIPRATLLGTGLTGVLYLFVCSGIILLLPTAIITGSAAPFSDFVAHFWGSGPALFIALFAAISALGALNGLTLVQGAVPLSLVRTGGFPRWFGKTNAAGAPVRALAGSSVLTSILVMLNSSQSLSDAFTFMALLATSVTLFLYFGVAAAALKLRVGGVIGVAAALFSLWTLWGAGWQASLWSLILLLTGVPVFWLVRRSGVSPLRSASL
jgi:basic amino acid/polyamine antiporter, APA family